MPYWYCVKCKDSFEFEVIYCPSCGYVMKEVSEDKKPSPDCKQD